MFAQAEGGIGLLSVLGLLAAVVALISVLLLNGPLGVGSLVVGSVAGAMAQAAPIHQPASTSVG